MHAIISQNGHIQSRLIRYDLLINILESDSAGVIRIPRDASEKQIDVGNAGARDGPLPVANTEWTGFQIIGQETPKGSNTGSWWCRPIIRSCDCLREGSQDLDKQKCQGTQDEAQIAPGRRQRGFDPVGMGAIGGTGHGLCLVDRRRHCVVAIAVWLSLLIVMLWHGRVR